MATTTNGVPYPIGTDPADVPFWMQQLAQKVDDLNAAMQTTVNEFKPFNIPLKAITGFTVQGWATGEKRSDGKFLVNFHIILTKTGSSLALSNTAYTNVGPIFDTAELAYKPGIQFYGTGAIFIASQEPMIFSISGSNTDVFIRSYAAAKTVNVSDFITLTGSWVTA